MLFAVQAKKNGRVGAEGNIGRLTLAAGTAVGTVRAFSAATTELVWTAKNCNEGCALADVLLSIYKVFQ